MTKSDRELGMGRRITRRDFIHDTSLAALGLTLFPGVSAGNTPAPGPAGYPPTRTGMRGSHPGSFEVAHALRDGESFANAKRLDEHYDLIVVGAGISGLAAAHYFRQRVGKDARILILENHDDFGGHAKRNEFHQGGAMKLSLGGTHNLEYWQFSDTVNALMQELGIDVDEMRRNMEFKYGYNAPKGPAIWFDRETYGEDRLVTNYTLESYEPGASLACIDEFPLSRAARNQLKHLFEARTNVLTNESEAEARAHLASMSYPDFLRRYAGLGEEALQIFQTSQHGLWGVELRALSAAEAIFYGNLPGLNLIGKANHMTGRNYPVAMFPDGNASVARLLVHRLIPEVAPGANANNIAMAHFDYSKLDRDASPVCIRLESTVINATNAGKGVEVTYIKDGEPFRVNANRCVMACYHSILPWLCPDLPEAQKEAQRYQVKIPLLLTNVLLRSSEAMDKLGIDAVSCPGRMHRSLFMFKGINTGGYAHHIADKGPVPLVFWGSLSPPADVTPFKEQLRASRQRMLDLTFADYEREVRQVLDGLLGPAGFDTKNDILAITVNRWPHGYAHEYLDLWDPDWPDGEAPHQIARRPHGNITFANADAGAAAYTHVAIDEAYRVIAEMGLE